MVLLIDNYDSFTYNLYQVLRELTPASPFSATTQFASTSLSVWCRRTLWFRRDQGCRSTLEYRKRRSAAWAAVRAF